MKEQQAAATTTSFIMVLKPPPVQEYHVAWPWGTGPQYMAGRTTCDRSIKSHLRKATSTTGITTCKHACGKCLCLQNHE